KLPFPRVWETGVLCSLLLPPLVIGLLLVFMVGPYTPIGELLGHFNLSATNTFLALVIAEVYESAPYYVLGAQSAFASVEPRLEQQAGLLGDRPRRVFRRVTLPLAAPGLAMALSIAWARAMGAFGAVIIIAYHPMGIPLQIYTTLQETGLPSALPYALVLLVVALPLPLAAYIWSARAGRRRRPFRRSSPCCPGSAGLGSCGRIPGCSRTCRSGTTCAMHGPLRLPDPNCPHWLRCSGSRACCPPCPPDSPAARPTGWRSAACCWPAATRCSSTSPIPAWTRACAGRSPTWSAP